MIDYQNDPQLDGKYLGTITQDFVKVAETLKEAAYQIKVRKISDHPIFIFCPQAQPLGQLLIGKEEWKEPLKWHISLSFLAEFKERQIIDEEGAALFKQNYKDIEEFACLFVIEKDFTNFIFLPYPEEE